MLIVVAIIWIIIAAVVGMYNPDKTADIQRKNALQNTAALLEEFKQKYWTYPNTTAGGRRFPDNSTYECNIDGYDALMNCFVKLWLIQIDTDVYNKIAFDPQDEEINEWDETYKYYYCTNTNWTKYKLTALAWDQSQIEYRDQAWGIVTEAGTRHLVILSSNAKIAETSISATCAE